MREDGTKMVVGKDLGQEPTSEELKEARSELGQLLTELGGLKIMLEFDPPESANLYYNQ